MFFERLAPVWAVVVVGIEGLVVANAGSEAVVGFGFVVLVDANVLDVLEFEVGKTGLETILGTDFPRVFPQGQNLCMIDPRSTASLYFAILRYDTHLGVGD